MTKESLFQASFEESLNLEDDGFLQYQLKEQDKKLAKFPKKGYFSLKTRLISLVLTLLFPIGLNFILVPILMVLRDDAENLTIPISKHELLTVEVYFCCLLIWLVFVLIGKRIKRLYLFPYRFHFHTITYLIWLVLEFDLAGIELTLPTLTVWGILIFFMAILLLGYWMFGIKYRSIRKLLYAEKSAITIQNKVAKILSIYGTGILGLAVLIKQFFSIFTSGFSDSLKGLGLLLTWFIANLAIIAMLIFLEFPYFLQAYYKWKYPEEYREWEGKSLEEWYGKKYLKKHPELLKKGLQ
ncbi:hypothetical protein [Streptococcus macacae]|uniref:Membrane protein n=1 Tax=Streptococcus macacae NCTC 11558 TaxID=764298 RepID=G5JX88_9STRE|nr:hypothetical protein [Streptococcus macacae]EHJ52154.1 putative membrane protein [Streptococcus macacae NCTC 11558]